MVGRIYYLLDPISKEIRYIGQTQLTIERRAELHWRHRKQGKNKNNYASNWISKLWETHKVKPIAFLIEEKECSGDELNQLEIEYIKEYSQKGFKLTNTSYNLQYRQKEYKKFVFGKKVYCYDKNYNELVFINARQASQETGICYKEISRIALGNRSNKVLTFSFSSLNKDEIEEKFKTKNKIGIKIIGKHIETLQELIFKTQQEAATALSVNFRNISECLLGKRLSCAGYLWRYEDSDFKREYLVKKVIHIETDIEYENLKQCSESTGITVKSICYNINHGKTKKFKYAFYNKLNL